MQQHLSRFSDAWAKAMPSIAKMTLLSSFLLLIFLDFNMQQLKSLPMKHILLFLCLVSEKYRICGNTESYLIWTNIPNWTFVIILQLTMKDL